MKTDPGCLKSNMLKFGLTSASIVLISDSIKLFVVFPLKSTDTVLTT